MDGQQVASTLTAAVIINIADNLACLQTAIRDGEIAPMSEIVKNFRRFDTDLCGWASPSSEEEYTWDPAIDTIQDPDAVWQGVYHVYNNHYICESSPRECPSLSPPLILLAQT